MDRYKGAYAGDGDWTTVKRFYLTQDNDLELIASKEIADLGELDSGDPQTLVDFATWAIQTYPAEKYMLILSDHGAGWVGGWNDNDPVPESSFITNSIDQALKQIVDSTGIGQFELVGFDACLMSQLESISALAPYAKYAVASEETEPALGWAYAAFLTKLVNEPQIDGAELAKSIVYNYIVGDTRIVDNNARLKFLSENFGINEDVPAEQVAKEMSSDITLAAIDISAISGLNTSVNDLAVALKNVDPGIVAEARSYAQSFQSVFGEKDTASYIDLAHFSALIADGLGSGEAFDAANQVIAAVQKAILAEKHGDNRPGSTGISIYFPVSDLFNLTTQPETPLSYVGFASRFAAASLWDDYLMYYYTGQEFDPTMADPSVLEPVAVAAVAQALPEVKAQTKVVEVTAPASGGITIAPLQASASEIGPDGKITINTEVTGKNVGYIYIYSMYYYEKDGSFLAAESDYIFSENTKEVNGVVYPDWGTEDVIRLEVEWTPTIYFITDGNEANDQFALFEPQTYGVTSEQDTYAVRGVYTFADSGDQRGATLEFTGEGKFKRLLIFMNKDGSGAPRVMTPNPGDQFTITDQWLEFKNNPEGEFVDYDGGTMTFGEKPLEWVPYYSYAGQYVVGIVVEDLDGKTTEEFVEVIVTDK